MEHVSESRWVDFVRGVSGPAISADIRAHVGAGCPKCETALDGWSRVRRLATKENVYAPPENLVRLVKLGFASNPANQPRKWTLADLVFDSFAQPLSAGVRSGALNVWQVVYEAEGVTVDLRFGRRSQSNSVHLIGQVLNKKELRAWQNATIELATEQEELVATSGVSAMGEFHIEFEAAEHLWLSVKAEGCNSVRLPLTNPRLRVTSDVLLK
jgi:hypothetical protein